MTDEPKNTEQKQNDTQPKIRIMVTAFQPFDDKINITEYILKNLSIKNPNIEIIPVVLSMNSYGELKDELSSKIGKEKPDFILMLGEANDRNTNSKHMVSLEYDSTLDSNVRDKKGKYAQDYYDPMPEVISHRTYRSKFLNESAEKFCKDNEIGFQITETISHDSRMQCNFATFVALDEMGKIGKGNNVIFMHVYDMLRERFDIYKPTHPYKTDMQTERRVIDSEDVTKANLGYVKKYSELVERLIEDIYTEKTQFKNFQFQKPLDTNYVAPTQKDSTSVSPIR